MAVSSWISHLAAFFSHLHATLHLLSQLSITSCLSHLLRFLQLLQAGWRLLQQVKLLVDEVFVGKAAGPCLGASHDANIAELPKDRLAFLAGVELLLVADLLGKERSAKDKKV